MVICDQDVIETGFGLGWTRELKSFWQLTGFWRSFLRHLALRRRYRKCRRCDRCSHDHWDLFLKIFELTCRRVKLSRLMWMRPRQRVAGRGLNVEKNKFVSMIVSFMNVDFIWMSIHECRCNCSIWRAKACQCRLPAITTCRYWCWFLPKMSQTLLWILPTINRLIDTQVKQFLKSPAFVSSHSFLVTLQSSMIMGIYSAAAATTIFVCIFEIVVKFCPLPSGLVW